MEELRRLEKILKALANKRRLVILRFLKKNKNASVGEIAEEIGISFKSTSKHLTVLSAVDVVEKEQKSLTMFYYISDNQHQIVRLILSII